MCVTSDVAKRSRRPNDQFHEMTTVPKKLVYHPTGWLRVTISSHAFLCTPKDQAEPLLLSCDYYD